MKSILKKRIHNLKSAKKKHKRELLFKFHRKSKRRSYDKVPRKQRNYNDRLEKLRKYHISIVAPSILSLNKSAEDYVEFINKFDNLRQKCRQKGVLFDLSKVKEIDFSGISLLIALVYKLKIQNITFNGLNPKDPELFLKLEQYNFFQQIGLKPSFNNIHFSLGKRGDKITIKGDKRVKPELGLNIAEYVSSKLFNENNYFNDGLQTIFLELMANTTKWSFQENEDNLWLLIMSYNKIEKNIDFQFIDFGIGIFESLNKSGEYTDWLSKIRSVVSSNATILQKMLEGKSKVFKSSTGLYFRGKGIPSIKENYENNYYQGVEILSNNVYAHLDLNKYINMKQNFNGTLIRWSISADNNFINFAI